MCIVLNWPSIMDSNHRDCLEKIFIYGIILVKNLNNHIFFSILINQTIIERISQQFESALREEVERQQLTGLTKEDRRQEFSIMARFIKLVSRINSSSSQLGKDDKFQLFICLAARYVISFAILIRIFMFFC